MTFKLSNRQGEHWLLIGPTGSGKTFLLERLLRSYPFVVVLDSKDELYWKGFRRVRSIEPIARREGTHFIYAPGVMPDDIPQVANVLFLLLYQMRGWTVAIDEVYSLAVNGNPNSYPSSYNLLLTRGRSRGITVLTATQRPRLFPLFAWTESKNFAVFMLDSEDDALIVSRQLNKEVAQASMKLKEFCFVYYSKKERKVHLARPLRKEIR